MTTVTRKISMFDWNGSTEEDMKVDAVKFGFEIVSFEAGEMGFLGYELAGEDAKLEAFLEFYDLEWDDE